jgi:hypothetical protein
MGIAARNGFRFLTTAVFLCGAAAASAQAKADSTLSTGDEKPETVIVTAKKLEEELPDILAAQGVRVDTISADQIAKGAFIDVAQALQYDAPGLF